MTDSSIASPGREAYCRAMVALRLLRFLTLVALLVAPMKMMSAHAEMAMPTSAAGGHHMAATAASDHCGGMDQSQKDRPASTIDCSIACSACPSADTAIAIHPHGVSDEPSPAATNILLGCHPESDPPPPRFA